MRYSGMRSWIGTRWAQWDGTPCQSPVPPTGGYLAHSLAIMTDAAHLLTDVGSMAVSLFSLWVSTRPPTTTMTFGWHRSGEGGGGSALGLPTVRGPADPPLRPAETLGALASVLSIWVVTAVLLYLAAARILSADYEIEARTMLATSACAVGANLVYVPPSPSPFHPQPQMRPTAPVLSDALPAAWPTSCTRATGTAWGAMSSWRGAACPAVPPCLAAPASAPPSCTWWGTCCRVWASCWRPPSSTSRCGAELCPPWGGTAAPQPHTIPPLPPTPQPQCKIADPISTLFFSVFVLGSTVTILRDVFRVLMEGEGDVGVPRGCSPPPTALPCPSQPYGEQLPPFPSPKWRKGLGVTPWRRSPAGNGSERSDGGAAGSQWGEGHPRPTRVGVDAEPPPGVGARGCG